MIALDLVDAAAPVRGDTYVHVLEFLDSAGDPLPMWPVGTVYECEFRNRSNTLAVVATVVQGATDGELQLEATIPSTLPASEIGGKLWTWDVERNESGIITTIIGGKLQIKPDAANSPGPN